MTDRHTVQAVILFLGVAVLLGLSLGGYLTAVDRGVPDFIVSSTSVALGALAGILAKTSTEPTSVTVDNEANDPVPVRAAAAKKAVR